MIAERIHLKREYLLERERQKLIEQGIKALDEAVGSVLIAPHNGDRYLAVLMEGEQLRAGYAGNERLIDIAGKSELDLEHPGLEV